MYEILFSDQAAWFSIPAFVGTAVFLLRIVLMFIGDLGLDLHDTSDLHHADPSEAFKILSIQSVAAFLMGFGWGGLGALKGTGYELLTSLAIAFFCGVAMMWVLGLALKAIHDLQTSGNIDPAQTIGAEATVYANIPAAGQGAGQVQVIIDQRQRTYNAVSTGPALASHERVRVVGVNDPTTLSVAPA